MAATAALALQLLAGARIAARPTAMRRAPRMGHPAATATPGFTTTFAVRGLQHAVEAVPGGGRSPAARARRPEPPQRDAGTQEHHQGLLHSGVAACGRVRVHDRPQRMTRHITFAVMPAAVRTNVGHDGPPEHDRLRHGRQQQPRRRWPRASDLILRDAQRERRLLRGFGNTSLDDRRSSNNKQSAKLTGPARSPSTRRSTTTASTTLYGGFPAGRPSTVNVGLTPPQPSSSIIAYPKNTQAPNSYVHVLDGPRTTSTSCARKGDPRSDASTWDKKALTATPTSATTGPSAGPASPDRAARQAVAGSASSSLTRAADDRSPFAS